MRMDNIELEGLIRTYSAENLAEVVRVISDKLLTEDIRERTDVTNYEIVAFSLQRLVGKYFAQRGLDEVNSILAEFKDEYLTLKISRVRKGRAELIRFATKIVQKLREREDREDREVMRL